MPELEEVSREVGSGNYDKAATAYRDFYLQKNVKSVFAVPLLNMNDFDETIKATMNLPDDINWFSMKSKLGLQLKNIDFMALIFKWRDTGDIKYLEKWFSLAWQQAKYSKSQYDKLSGAELSLPSYYGMPQSWDWGHGFNCYSFNTTNERGLLQAIEYMAKFLRPEQKSLVPADKLIEILYRMVQDDIPMIIKDSRAFVGNQCMSNATYLLLYAKCLYEFKDANAWLEEAGARFKISIGGTILKDFGDLEQALGYNFSLLKNVAKIREIIGGVAYKWQEELERLALGRFRMFCVLSQPFGGLPSTGSGSGYFPPAIYKEESTRQYFKALILKHSIEDLEVFEDMLSAKIIDNLYGNKVLQEPDFTSIYLPYSGYCTMRDGWSEWSKYLFMMTSRKGSGHACENINDVQISAFGRLFLASSGAGYYGIAEFVPKEQLSYMDQIDRYRTDTYGRNSVIVDGYSQKRLLEGENMPMELYTDTINARWHTSDRYDFCEGLYADGYGDKDITIDASHLRQVVFLKNAGVWVVTDIMKCSGEHSFSQTWNFPSRVPQDTYAGIYGFHLNKENNHPDKVQDEFYIDGFDDSHIIIDEENFCVYTNDIDAPNIDVYSVSSAPISYKRYFGELDPARGWFAPLIRGRRFPKTDVHISWSGNDGGVLVSLISPTPNQQRNITIIKRYTEDGVTGFEAMTNDGIRIVYKTSNSCKKDIVPGIDAKTVILEYIGKKVTGIIIDGAINGINASCECIIENDSVNIVAEIKVPTDFQWTNGDYIYPKYHSDH